MARLLINLVFAFVRLSVQLIALAAQVTVILVREFLKLSPKAQAVTGGVVLAIAALGGLIQLVSGGPTAPSTVSVAAVSSVAAADPVRAVDPVPVAVSVPAETPPQHVGVTSAFDAATLTLSDGRTVRVGGIAVQASDTCAGAAALDFVEQRLRAAPSRIDPFGGTDENGHPWVEVSFLGGPYPGPLSLQLAQQGYAEPYDQGASAAVVAAVAQLAGTARSGGLGQWGPPCATPAPAPDVADSGGASTAPYLAIPDGNDYCDTCPRPRVHVPHPYVSRPHVSRPHLPHIHLHW